MNSIQQLILLGKGDRGRLEYIFGLLQSRRVLPTSDQKYLENIIPLYLRSEDISSSQKRYEHAIEELHKEIQTLNQKILKPERKSFERYIGKKAVLFFVTLFVGWNALQTFTYPVFHQFMSDDLFQYLFPLNLLTNYFNMNSLVWFVFILMVLAWPFIGAIRLTNFIRLHKFSNEL